MKIAELAIKKKVVNLFATFLVLGGGIISYEQLGRLEDPDFTIKDAKIITIYPGATPKEVELEVTDIIETEIQRMPQLKWIKESLSMKGQSTITPQMKDEYWGDQLGQVWDELRRKILNIQGKLPPGAQTPIVNDDFGDVYGIFLAVTGDGYSYRELKDYVDMLRREMLQVSGVAKISLQGVQQEQIFAEVSRNRIAQLGIPLEVIYETLGQQNTVADAGDVRVGSEYITIDPTGKFISVEAIGDLLIPDPEGRLIYMRDVATISRGYQDPPQSMMRYDGQPALGIGISTVPGGNVVQMGTAVEQKLLELAPQTPLGIELHTIAYQSKAVTEAINGFVINLAEAIAIVIGVLLLFMGLRAGLIIGFVLLITIFATLIVMNMMDISLQRISLGALIIALGMLVDNAIVICDGIIVRINKGMDKIAAANEIVGQTAIPLLGATAIAVLAFAPIGLSSDSTGEYCQSLFLVMLISLSLSWLTALTTTPLLCHMFLKATPQPEGGEEYGGAFYNGYRSVVGQAIRFRYATLLLMVGLLAAAIFGFGFLKDSFFPPATRNQFMYHHWLPQGTDIRSTSADLQELEQYVLAMDGVTNVSTFVGGGATRFLLTYSPEDNNSAYGMLLIDVEDYSEIEEIAQRLYMHALENFPEAQPLVNGFDLGPGQAFKVQARFSGPDGSELRRLADEAMAIMREHAQAQGVSSNWRQQVKVLEPQFSEAQARRTGITRPDLSRALEGSFGGTQVGLYREQNKLIPIVSRPPPDERVDVNQINDVQIWSPVAERAIPMRQVVSGFETDWQDAIIARRDRKRTITVRSTPMMGGLGSEVLAQVKPHIDAMELPPGYTLQWGGEFEDSERAQKYIAAGIPVPFLLMVFTLVLLFNNLRQPAVILLTVPLAIIGVSAGLLATDEPFGFMALLGFLSLSGMLIKNAIVLIDEINSQLNQGLEVLTAIIESGVSRVRPVAMAAATTMLGMIPLFTDPFYIGMAVTIVSGLGFATVLTLVVVPVLYATLYRVSSRVPTAGSPGAGSVPTGGARAVSG